jgi:sensor histidine kinase YesM
VRRWITIAAVWLVLALVLASHTWLSVFSHGHSPARIALYELSVWAYWAALTPLLFALARRLPLVPFRLRNALVHAAIAVPVVILHIVWWIGMTVVMRPYDSMTQTTFSAYFPKTFVAQLPFELMLYFAVVAVGHIVELRDRALRLEQSLAGARLHALELQLQPHFLFNTLNTVSSLVRMHKEKEAVEVVAGLSDLLRYTLDHAGSGRVPLGRELAMLERYLEIQRVRFEDRLTVTVEVDDEARRASVPTLILQPLAENAVRHGVERSAGPGRIEVRAARRDDMLMMEVFNSGAMIEGPRGIGLRNTEERLRELYGKNFRFELHAAGGGVLATIAIPWSEAAA